MTAPAVSVVVATYNSGAALDQLMASLARQTLPQSEFEVLLVDDGSTGDTWQRLQAIRAAHDNVRIEQIAHSGWPSRPRNVGLGMATGEFVLFADHDDEVFSDGLRAGLGFAREHELDIASMKTVDTSQPGYAFGAYRRDSWGTRAEMGVLTLLPMMPHKLYRRSMLVEHGVRFREGGRVVYEDIYFNLDAYAAAARLGTLSSTPVYRHIIGTANASHSYRPETEEYWRAVVGVLEHISHVLGDEEFRADREALYRHHYRGRVLTRVVSILAAGNREVFDQARPYIDDIRSRFLPADSDDGWSARDRRVEQLLRRNDIDALAALSVDLSKVIGISRADRLEWDGDALVLEATAAWSEPPSVVAAGLLGARDEDERSRLRGYATAAESSLILRSRSGQQPETVPTRSALLELEESDPLRTLRLAAAGRIVGDSRWASGPWDVFVRNSAFGFSNTRGLRTSLPTRVGLVDGRAVVAYRNRRGMLAVDFDQQARSVVNSALRGSPGPQIRRTLTGKQRVVLPLPEVHVHGRTRIEGIVVLRPVKKRSAGSPTVVAAALIGDRHGARVEWTVRLPPGRYELAFGFDPAAGPDDSRPSDVVLRIPSKRRPVR